MPQPLVLIIEDQHNLAILYEDALRLVGFNAVAKHDGLEALNHLAMSQAPDFVILDINLPRLSGREIFKHIRGSDKYKDMPVLILTANSLMVEQLRPELTANDQLVVKPIGMLELQNIAKKVRKDMNERLASSAETQVHSVITIDEDSSSEEISGDNSDSNSDNPSIPTEANNEDEAI